MSGWRAVHAVMQAAGLEGVPASPKGLRHGFGVADVLPRVVLDERVAIVGTSGAGKTYAAKSRVERLPEAGARVCVVDPLGVWPELTKHPDSTVKRTKVEPSSLFFRMALDFGHYPLRGGVRPIINTDSDPVGLAASDPQP
jgi:hypothetical protein